MFSKIWKQFSGKSANEAQEQIDQLDSSVVSLYEEGRYEEAIEHASLSAELTRQAVGQQHR